MGLFEENPLLLVPIMLVVAGLYDVLKHLGVAIYRRAGPPTRTQR